VVWEFNYDPRDCTSRRLNYQEGQATINLMQAQDNVVPPKRFAAADPKEFKNPKASLARHPKALTLAKGDYDATTGMLK
jgi:hypothetical protein